MQKIISWNVASLRARFELLESFLKEEKPALVLLQEIKVEDEQFPYLELQSLGYHAEISGQKSWNGVAVLAQEKMTLIQDSLPGFEDQARFIEVKLSDGIHVISVYVPNGTAPANDPQDMSRLTYKLKWMDALTAHVKALLNQKIPFILGGDFNVIYEPGDVYDAALFQDSALMVPPVRERFKALLDTGVIPTLRFFNQEPGLYSFWDFQGGAWPRNHGILLDAIFISPDLKGRLKASGVAQKWRGQTRPSDHAPIYCELDS